MPGFIDFRKHILYPALAAAIGLFGVFLWKPMDHSYNVNHVSPEALIKWQATMETRVAAQEKATERLMVRTDSMAQDLQDIKAGINDINSYLRGRPRSGMD